MGLFTMRIRGLFRLKPKISIIVPFYNAENYILRCLESIVLWTQTPYEVICVNDGSTDNSLKIVNRFRLTHPQVRLISFGKNKGLYLARLAGMKKARGDYVGFLDSDDVVSKGYYDCLYASARMESADIAVGQVINVNKEGTAYLQTRCERFPYLRPGETEESIYEMFWRQEGLCYHWHVIWNKLYKKSLIQSSLETCEKLKQHLVMMEDFIFSAVILYKVHSYTVNLEAKYYYIDNPDSETQNSEVGRTKKSLYDIRIAFDFVGNFLASNSDTVRYVENLQNWKALYKKIWMERVNKMSIPVTQKKDLLQIVQELTEYDCDGIDSDYYYELAKLL